MRAFALIVLRVFSGLANVEDATARRIQLVVSQFSVFAGGLLVEFVPRGLWFVLRHFIFGWLVHCLHSHLKAMDTTARIHGGANYLPVPEPVPCEPMLA